MCYYIISKHLFNRVTGYFIPVDILTRRVLFAYYACKHKHKYYTIVNIICCCL